MDLDSIASNKEVKEIINYPAYKKLCEKPEEGVLQLVKDFYARFL